MKYLLSFFIVLSPLITLADSIEDLAYKYAPVIFQNFDSSEPRLDFISAVDFDGDLIGNNNWENVIDSSLEPVVYYAIVSTSTHHYITYSLFHPRDWTSWCTGVFYECHENDMENIQVVVDKRNEEVVALVTQAHFWSSLYLKEESKDGYGKIFFVNNDGVESVNGRTGVFVESGGHAIYSLDRKNMFRDDVIIYHPERNSAISEPDLDAGKNFPYRLESTLNKFWIPILAGELYGSGELFNGTFNYEDPIVAWDLVPRHFDSDMMSGIGKFSSGIVPFAMGFSLLSRDLGGLFFNPAFHFKNELKLASSWSLRYTYHPYR